MCKHGIAWASQGKDSVSHPVATARWESHVRLAGWLSGLDLVAFRGSISKYLYKFKNHQNQIIPSFALGSLNTFAC